MIILSTEAHPRLKFKFKLKLKLRFFFLWGLCFLTTIKSQCHPVKLSTHPVAWMEILFLMRERTHQEQHFIKLLKLTQRERSTTAHDFFPWGLCVFDDEKSQ